MNSILIVGGAGYIGSHMVLYLLEKNIDVIVLDDLSTGSREAVTGGAFYKGDLADRSLLQTIFSSHKIDVVMHFAAFIRVDESVHNPSQYYQNNVVKTLVLLDEMMAAGIKSFVFSSTAAVYGLPQYVPVDLKHTCMPINPYGQSKLMVESVLKDYDLAYGLKSMVFRYFNAAGSDPKVRIGFHEPITHLIPQVLKAASGRNESITVFGNDYSTPDGTCVRDYIHVNDLVSAHYLGINKLLSGSGSSTYNLGTGDGFSVNEIIATVQLVTKTDFQIFYAEKRLGDPDRLVAEPSLAMKELNWQPQFSSLENIIGSAWLWELNPIWHAQSQVA